MWDRPGNGRQQWSESHWQKFGPAAPRCDRFLGRDLAFRISDGVGRDPVRAAGPTVGRADPKRGPPLLSSRAHTDGMRQDTAPADPKQPLQLLAGRVLLGGRGPCAVRFGHVEADLLDWLRAAVKDDLAWSFAKKQPKDRKVELGCKLELVGHLKGPKRDSKRQIFGLSAANPFPAEFQALVGQAGARKKQERESG